MPWTGSLNLGTFPVGSSNTIIIRGTVDLTADGAITNTAIGNSSANDPNPNNNTSTVTIPVAALEADMEVVKTAIPNPVIAGEQITFTIVVSNFGPNDAQNVILTDIIEPKITDAEYSTDGGIIFNPWDGSLALGTFTNGETQTIIIRENINSGATGTITNTAIVSSSTLDPNIDNNTSTIGVQVTESADISISKLANPNPVAAGDEITFTMNISNLGPSDAQDVVLSDMIPTQVINAQYSIDDGITFNTWLSSTNIGTIISNTSKIVIIKGIVNSSALETFANTATVSSTTPDPDPTNNVSTVIVTICDTRCQAIADIIDSVALEQAGLSRILNAEGQKIQAILAMPDVSVNLLLKTNKSVQSMTNAIGLLETILADKLALFNNCLCCNSQNSCIE